MKKLCHWVSCLLSVLALFLCPGGSCFAEYRSFDEQVHRLMDAIPQGDRVAVSHIYDRTHGDYTELGNLYRDRLENLLGARGFSMAPRRDLGLLAEDTAFYGPPGKVREVLESAGADTVVWGRYHQDRDAKGKDRLVLFLNAVRMPCPSHGRMDLGSVEVREAFDPKWAALASRIFGNHYRQGLETIGPAGTKGPMLKARLDREPPCYPPGSEATLAIETLRGAHVYILGLQADGTAVLFYPNTLMPDRPILDGRLTFPPPAMEGKVALELYPLVPGESCREAFKVIASEGPLDFGFLPVPQNDLFAGARGGDLARVLAVLKAAAGWSEATLAYWVSDVCR